MLRKLSNMFGFMDVVSFAQETTCQETNCFDAFDRNQMKSKQFLVVQ